jgi:hypothetical protein
MLTYISTRYWYEQSDALEGIPVSICRHMYGDKNHPKSFKNATKDTKKNIDIYMTTKRTRCYVCIQSSTPCQLETQVLCLRSYICSCTSNDSIYMIGSLRASVWICIVASASISKAESASVRICMAVKIICIKIPWPDVVLLSTLCIHTYCSWWRCIHMTFETICNTTVGVTVWQPYMIQVTSTYSYKSKIYGNNNICINIEDIQDGTYVTWLSMYRYRAHTFEYIRTTYVSYIWRPRLLS